MNKKKKVSQPKSQIAVNRKAGFEYALEQTFEAGIVLLGWEVKSLRAGKGNIAESYVVIKRGEAFLLGSQITPLLSASTHVVADPRRTRKLLLHEKELSLLIGASERDGYTIVPLKYYWKKGLVKVQIAIAKGKKTRDKRQTIKDREWAREKGRILKGQY